MKIDSNKKVTHQELKKSQSPVSQSETSFAQTLKNERLAIFNTDMDKLLELLKSQADKFLKSPDLAILKSYKETLKSFLSKIKNEYLSLKEEFSTPRDGEQKLYQLVEMASKEVDALTKETLTDSASVKLLADLDEIRGLVVDILG